MSTERSRSFTPSSISEAYDQFMAPQLFEPWARELVSRAVLRGGSSVLDLASGPGPVARLAAAAIGSGGRVVASDISQAMLAVAAAKPVDPAWAPIEYLECAATAIESPDASFDVVFCQQGLQFFPDRTGAVREMRRVLRTDGIVLVSTWASERPIGLFGPMTAALREAGVAEPFPRAFDPESYCLSGGELRSLLSGAGLRDVVVETVELDAVWPDARAAVATLMGTPYGPSIDALSAEEQLRLRGLFAARLTHSPLEPVTVRTTSHLGYAIK